jgi:hypothetical protein
MQIRIVPKEQVSKTNKAKYGEVYLAIESLTDDNAIFVTGAKRHSLHMTIRKRKIGPVSICRAVVDGEEGLVIFTKEKQ